MCMCTRTNVYHGAYMEVGGKLVQVSSLLLCGLQDQTYIIRDNRQEPLVIELPH